MFWFKTLVLISYSMLPPSEFKGYFMPALHFVSVCVLCGLLVYLLVCFVFLVRDFWLFCFLRQKQNKREALKNVTIAGKERREPFLAHFQVCHKAKHRQTQKNSHKLPGSWIFTHVPLSADSLPGTSPF